MNLEYKLIYIIASKIIVLIRIVLENSYTQRTGMSIIVLTTRIFYCRSTQIQILDRINTESFLTKNSKSIT